MDNKETSEDKKLKELIEEEMQWLLFKCGIW